jgi:Pyruvate/2-oxoacid:ferredoxin oxidoreductase delta subunit
MRGCKILLERKVEGKQDVSVFYHTCEGCKVHAELCLENPNGRDHF